MAHVRASAARVLRLTVLLPALAAVVLASLAAPPRRADAVDTLHVVNSTDDDSDLTTVDGVCETATPGECTLRAAMEQANSVTNPGYDEIHFGIGAGQQTIAPLTPLPAITDQVVIDARTQPGWSAGNPQIVLDGSGAGPAANGFLVTIYFNQIYGFIIQNFSDSGIMVAGSSPSLVTGGNWLGLDAAGTGPAGNVNAGIFILSGTVSMGANNSGVDDFDVISGNIGDGVFIGSGSDFGSNFGGIRVGTNAAGTAAVGNGQEGIHAERGGWQMGKPYFTLERNIISGNTLDGIFADFTGPSPIAAIAHSNIGTDVTGTVAIPNGGDGIDADNWDLGGIFANIIANNSGDGVKLGPGVDEVSVRRNAIFNNGGGGITLGAGGNSGILPPTVTGIAPVNGTTCALCYVDVYSDTLLASEARTYHGTVQADGSGAWSFSGPITGTYVRAVANNGNDSSALSGTAVTKNACGSVCLEGFWHVDYTGTLPHYCSTHVNQDGTTTIWGHASCTDGVEFDYTGSLNQGLNTISIIASYPDGSQTTANGSFALDGNSASGTWTCTLVCAGSGSWTGSRHGEQITIPAGGGSSAFIGGVPSATVQTPIDPDTPAVTVDAVALTGTQVGELIMRTGFDFRPNAAIFSPVPVTVTVNFGSGQNAVPNDSCTGLFHYVQNPETQTWTFVSLIECDNIANTFTVELESFSVHRFATCPLSTTGVHLDGNFIDLPPSKAYDDVTRANSDAYEGACDPDDDNDGRSDDDEMSGTRCGSLAYAPSDPGDEDSDNDRVLDGAECDLGTNPGNASSKPTNVQCGGNSDMDGDGLPNFREVCYYNTDHTDPDTDLNLHLAGSDLCNDGEELASINGDTKVNSIDLSQVAQSFGVLSNPNYILDFDFTRDDNINSIDLSQIAQRFTGSNCT